MDELILSRIQFAAITSYHFLFVPLTLGLGVLVAINVLVYSLLAISLSTKAAESSSQLRDDFQPLYCP